MSAWDLYESRAAAHGRTKREATLLREGRMLDKKIADSLSYHNVLVDGVAQSVSISNTDNMDEKFMFSLHGQNVHCGSLIDWADNHWLVTEKDANTEIYTKVKLEQCNYLLHWVDNEDVIHEQWCIVSDGTKLERACAHVIVWHTGNGM